MVAFYGFHVAKYPIVSYGNPMIKSGSVNAVKLFEVALGCLAVLGSSKMTNLHRFWGSGFFWGKKNIFWGLSKTENHFWVFQKQEKKNFRLLQKTLAYTKQAPTCWKLQHIENAVSLLTTRFLWLYQTSMYLPGTHGSLNVKHPRRQYRETPIEQGPVDSVRYLYVH